MTLAETPPSSVTMAAATVPSLRWWWWLAGLVALWTVSLGMLVRQTANPPLLNVTLVQQADVVVLASTVPNQPGRFRHGETLRGEWRAGDEFTISNWGEAQTFAPSTRWLLPLSRQRPGNASLAELRLSTGEPDEPDEVVCEAYPATDWVLRQWAAFKSTAAASQ